MKYFRILSIDGGGARGIIPARIIENVDKYIKQQNSNNNLIDNFDLIAGTSTGGIIGLSLALGIETSKIVQLYEKLIPILFKKKSFSLFKPKYNSTLLKDILREHFLEYRISDLKADVVITSVSLQNATPRLHKTDYFDRNKGREDERILDIALATSAAPSYFKAHDSKYSSCLIDGGMCANNPGMIALTDAMYFERLSKSGKRIPEGTISDKLENIAMLSLGTGNQCSMKYDYRKLATGGIYHWGEHVFQIVTDNQSRLIEFQMDSMLGNRHKRINPTLTFPTSLDDINAVEYSKNLSDIPQDAEKWLRSYILG